MRTIKSARKAFALAAIVLPFFLTATTPANAASVQYTYDALGRVTSATYTNGTSISYSYDNSGNRTVMINHPPIPPSGNIWGQFNWGQKNW